MMKRRFISPLFFYCAIQLLALSVSSQESILDGSEKFRPQMHFSPKAHWINDPNGMVYCKGVYHLFFQYHPYSSVWGPMHWGHATSSDLVHWKEQPIAIYPDSIGTIFSGSAVMDTHNTSGLGEEGKSPLVAIFTQHDSIGEKSGRNDFQNQSIAYSNDEGKTWIKYAGNPVLKSPGLKNFRDPKVIWFEPQKKWIMVLAAGDHITFYSSPDLKSWSKESDYGKEIGAHGGVWECPDLITIDENGQQRWVLIVNLNPGGPNGGSGTQYFVGDFDGTIFTSKQADTRWLDYGPDNYAGVTWSNTGSRRILIGWMSNWLYANVVPTEKWRSAMTIPRELKLKQVGDDWLVACQPVVELSSIQSTPIVLKNKQISGKGELLNKNGDAQFPVRINLTMDKIEGFSIVLSNDLGEELKVGFDKAGNQYFIDRTKSGITDFQKDFAARHTAPRLTNVAHMDMTLLIDVSSVELFADDGLVAMTEIFFPSKSYNQIHIQSQENILIKKIDYINIQSTIK